MIQGKNMGMCACKHIPHREEERWIKQEWEGKYGKIFITDKIYVEEIWVFVFYSFKLSMHLKKFNIKSSKENYFLQLYLVLSLRGSLAHVSGFQLITVPWIFSHNFKLLYWGSLLPNLTLFNWDFSPQRARYHI